LLGIGSAAPAAKVYAARQQTLMKIKIADETLCNFTVEFLGWYP
tara:strand:+ start:9065 stop:9196 length:132 start_codon:yes stop_codon:yes gene_type:complete